MTDFNTVLLAVGPAAVTGAVGFHAARTQARSRIAELEYQLTDWRRRERAGAFEAYLAAIYQLLGRIYADALTSKWWHEDWLQTIYPVLVARVVLTGSAAVQDATEGVVAAYTEVIDIANKRVGGEDERFPREVRNALVDRTGDIDEAIQALSLAMVRDLA